MLPHSSAYINDTDVIIIRGAAAEAEQSGKLSFDQLEVVYREQWFKLLVPRVYGGLEITLPELVRLQEAASWADGSLGWVLTLCSGAGWFGGFLSPQIAQEIFSNPKVCLAGSGAATGTASVTEHGYLLNGTWNYASGAHHATHFTANCIIEKDGEQLLDGNGQPLVLPFVVDKKDVTLLPTWKYIGMVATGSHSFSINNLHVGNERQFNIDPGHAEIGGQLYQYPFLQLAEATLAVNLSGMALHFMELCGVVFEEKKQGSRLNQFHAAHLDEVLKTQTEMIEELRNNFFTVVDQSWNAMTETHLRKVSEASHKLAKHALQAVDSLYPYCGLKAAAPDTEINRVWRDIHTASQHALLTFADGR